MKQSKVHPHARGDFGVLLRRHGPASGPSPRAWGFHRGARLGVLPGRSIPTRVGISGPHLAASAPADHPHARGDFGAGVAFALERVGPSPRAWGFRARRPGGRAHGPSPRAWGFPVSHTTLSSSSPVHPHARGDFLVMRSVNETPSRSIPTRVGISRAAPSPSARSTDHPHARGDSARLFSLPAGISVHPHARGDFKAVGER